MFNIDEVKQSMKEYADIKVKEALQIAADNAEADYTITNDRDFRYFMESGGNINCIPEDLLEVSVITNSILSIKLLEHV